MVVKDKSIKYNSMMRKEFADELIRILKKKINVEVNSIYEINMLTKTTARSIVTEFKKKCKLVLNRVYEYVGVKDKLEFMREIIKQWIKDTDRILDKMQNVAPDVQVYNMKKSRNELYEEVRVEDMNVKASVPTMVTENKQEYNVGKIFK